MRSNPPSNWTRLTLADAVSLRRGLDLPVKDRAGGPVPVVGASGPVGHHNTAIVEGPSFTIGRSASIGHLTWVDNDFWPLNTTLYVTDPNGNNLRFLYYALHIVDFEAYNSGSVQPMLNRNYVANHPIVLPPRVEQDAVAEVLGALDDKIDLLHKQSNTVEEIVRALYQGLLIPSGESIGLSEIARYVNGGAFTKKADGHGRLIARIAELTKGPGTASRYGSFAVDNDHLARPGDLLFSWSATLDVFRWSRDEAIINQHIFKVVCDQGWPGWFAHCALKEAMPYFRALAADKATTMGHIKRDHLAQAEVTRPTDESLAQTRNAVEPLWQLQLQSLREAAILEELRDALLPRLVSGELRITDAERLVREAA